MARHKRNKGVPKGYTHIWAYKGPWKERKLGPGKWLVEFRATKSKRRSGRGGPTKGTFIQWGFKNVKQRAIKIGKGRYQTILTGIKYLKNFKPPKYRKNKRRRKR